MLRGMTPNTTVYVIQTKSVIMGWMDYDEFDEVERLLALTVAARLQHGLSPQTEVQVVKRTLTEEVVTE